MGLLIDVELLIASIEERPAIWDKTSEAYKDRNLTKAAWHEICCILKNCYEELSDTEQHNFGKSIIAKWTNLRDTWMRSQKKAIEFNKSGAGFKNVTKYRYHEKLSFLSKVFDNLSVYSPSTEDLTDLQEKGQREIKSSNPVTKSKEIPSTSNLQGPPSSCALNKKRKCGDIETTLLKFLKMSETSREKPHPHRLFFDSILPSVMNFNEDQVLEFRIGVLALIKKVKQRQTYVPVPVKKWYPNSDFQREYPDPLSNLPHPFRTSDTNPYFPEVLSASSHRLPVQSSYSQPAEELSPCSSANASGNSVRSQPSPPNRTNTSPLSIPLVKSSPSSVSLCSEDLDNYNDFSNDA